MHIADGIITSPALLAGTWTAAAAGVAYGLKRLDDDAVPRAGLFGSVFFVASLIHVNIGPSSAHLLLNGLLGLFLGWAAFPTLAVCLLLQAVFFGFGGIGALGANVLGMALPGVVVHYVFGGWLRRARRGQFWIGFAAGVVGVALTCLCFGAILFLADEKLLVTIVALVTAHLPVMGIEGVVAGGAVSFVCRAKPGLLELTRRPVVGEAAS